jgi:hypothetical protein
MGPHFATACMSVYGGHIWRTYNALLRLPAYRNAFTAFDGYVPQAFNKVEASLDADISRGGDMNPLLEDLCIKGYAPTKGSDPRAEVISHNNVGALLRASSTVGVLPDETRQLQIFGCVLQASTYGLCLLALCCEKPIRTPNLPESLSKKSVKMTTEENREGHITSAIVIQLCWIVRFQWNFDGISTKLERIFVKPAAK